MTIICSWCRHEGQTGVVGEKAPLDDRRETHGICVTHRSAVQSRLNELVCESVRTGLQPVPVQGGHATVQPAGRVAFSATQMWVGIRNLTRKAGF